MWRNIDHCSKCQKSAPKVAHAETRDSCQDGSWPICFTVTSQRHCGLVAVRQRGWVNWWPSNLSHCKQSERSCGLVVVGQRGWVDWWLSILFQCNQFIEYAFCMHSFILLWTLNIFSPTVMLDTFIFYDLAHVTIVIFYDSGYNFRYKTHPWHCLIMDNLSIICPSTSKGAKSLLL